MFAKSYKEIRRRLMDGPPPPPRSENTTIIRLVRQDDRPPPPAPPRGIRRGLMPCGVDPNLTDFEKLCTLFEMMLLPRIKPFEEILFESIRTVHRVTRNVVTGPELGDQTSVARVHGYIALRLIGHYRCDRIGYVFNRQGVTVAQIFGRNRPAMAKVAKMYGLEMPKPYARFR